MLSLLKSLFQKDRPFIEETDIMKKFLIVGLGNIGEKYLETRHNIGFKVLDALAKKENFSFETQKLGDVATFKHKGKTALCLNRLPT